ncbi:unnamed protein product [Pylaiella littoralis]
MGDVIEPCADGGFDIPTTPVAIPVSRLTSQSSNDHFTHKPRRIRIQLEDDDDGDVGNDDDREEGNDGDRDPGRVPVGASADQLLAGTKIAQCTNNVARATDVEEAAGGSENIVSTPALNRPEYRIYKIETPNEDPMLEILVYLSSESKVAPVSTTSTAINATKTNGTPSSDKNCCRGSCPSVSVSSDGRSVVVDQNPPTEGSGGGSGGVGLREGRFSLKLPQRVVPGTAISFFWEGDLTVRATLADVE